MAQFLKIFSKSNKEKTLQQKICQHILDQKSISVNIQQKNKNKNNKGKKDQVHLIKTMKTFQNRSQISVKSSRVQTNHVNTTQTLSPVKSQLYNSLNSDKKQIITKLLYLFTFYSSKISKYSYRELNEKIFIHLISDLYTTRNHRELIKNSVQQKEFLNIFYSMRGKKIGSGLRFEQFLQCLPIISVFMCPEIDIREQAVKQLIQYLIVLYDTKIAELIENHVVEYEQPINDQTKEMIIKLMQSFITVYQVLFLLINLQKLYFNHQHTGKFNIIDLQNESFEALMKMMKDFQVFPKLLSASQLYLLYNTTLNSQPNNLLHETEGSKCRINDQGRLFTLSKMIEFMIACSRICYARLKNLQNPEYDIANQKEIFKTFLEYIQAIKTTKTSAKIIAMFQQHRFSFILLSQYQRQGDKDKMTKTFVLKDKIVKEKQDQMEFFGLFDKLHL